MSILIKKGMINNEKKDMLIQDGKITEIADSISVEAEHKIDAENKAVLPGLQNHHTHTAMTLLRGYADDMPLKEWLEQKIWPKEKTLTEEQIYWGTRLGILEMIKTGTTYFNDMYWKFPEILKAVKDTGINATLASPIIGQADKEQIRKEHELAKEHNIEYALGPHAIYTVPKETLQWVKDYSEKHGLKVHMHVGETEEETDDCESEQGMKPIHYLNSIGLVNQRFTLAHGIWLSDSELEVIAKKQATIVHCPVSNMKLCAGSAIRYEDMKERGINLKLGTDGASSNNNLDMFETMKIAALLQKHDQERTTTMPAEEVWKMATGELKEGAQADIIIADLKRPEMTPNHNLISNLVYSASGNIVNTTIAKGKILMKDRKVEREEEVIEKAEELARLRS